MSQQIQKRDEMQLYRLGFKWISANQEEAEHVFREMLLSWRDQIEENVSPAVRDAFNPETLFSLAYEAAMKNKYLLVCHPDSLRNALLQSARLGLQFGTMLQHAYLIPRKNGEFYEANFEPSYKGLIHLGVRNGIISHADAHVVREQDEIDIQLGTDPKIYHKPNLDDDGEMIGAYSVLWLPSGLKKFKWLSKKRIEQIRDQSQSYKSNPRNSVWGKWPEEMWLKTVVRHNFKLVDLSPDLALAIDLAAKSEAEVSQFDTVALEAPSRAAERPALKDRVTASLGALAAPSVDEKGPENTQPAGEDSSALYQSAEVPKTDDSAKESVDKVAEVCRAKHISDMVKQGQIDVIKKKAKQLNRDPDQYVRSLAHIPMADLNIKAADRIIIKLNEDIKSLSEPLQGEVLPPKTLKHLSTDYGARHINDLVTPKQLVAIRAIGSNAGMAGQATEDFCKNHFDNLRPEELNKAAASELIEKLKQEKDRYEQNKIAMTPPVTSATERAKEAVSNIAATLGQAIPNGKITFEHLNELRGKIADSSLTEPDILARYDVEDLRDIPDAKFEDALKYIKMADSM